MCGIAGSLNFSLPVEQVQSMLVHRGPDEQSSWTDGSLHFIHTRLAIQDLTEGGSQPRHEGDLHIIFNGEIYNHFELRKKYDLTCKTSSDTETLLHLFRLKHLNMLHELDGMFAMAIYDAKAQKLWICRDRAGEKPLYYSFRSNQFIFASELNALVRLVRPEINRESVSAFLSIGYVPGPDTPYVGVSVLEPATWMEIDIKTMTHFSKKWWRIAPFYGEHPKLGFAESLERTDELLNLSVKRRLLTSDREVGAFLSGGIDSGLVSAMAARHTRKLKTFTVSFEGMYDESPLAARAAECLETDHHRIQLGFDSLVDDIESIFSNYGGPIMDDSIIPSYYVAREAKRHLTVVLTGDAGDELFGGYRRYVPLSMFDFFSERRSQRVVKRIVPFMRYPGDKMSAYSYLYRLMQLASSKGSETYFRATNDLLSPEDSSFLVKPDLFSVRNSLDEVAGMSISSLKRIMLMDFENILPAILLVKMDIATMAHSLEGRSPFLSRELLEFAPSIDDRFKVKGIQTKYLLRQLAKKYLPPDFANRPKRGFEIPLRDWVDTRLRPVIQDFVGQRSFLLREIIDPVFVDRLLENKVPEIHAERRAKILFSWMSVGCWSKNYLK